MHGGDIFLKRKRSSRMWWMLFLAGIIVGAVCAGLCISKIQMTDVRSVLYIQQLKSSEYNIQHVFGHIFFKRICFLAGLIISLYVCSVPVPFICVTFLLGIASGYLMTVMAAGYGIKGYFFLGAMMLPHYIFYAAAYIILLRLAVFKYKNKALYSFKRTEDYRTWAVITIVIFLIVGAGIVCETYLNPLIINSVIHKM